MTLSSARTTVWTIWLSAFSSSTGMRPSDKLAKLQTTKSPGLVVVTTTVSPSLVSTSVLTVEIGAMFWAISVHRFEQ